MTIRIEPLLIRLSFTFHTFSPWNLAVWAGSCRWRLWVTSRYPRLSSGCRREDPGPALHRNDDLNDQDQEIYRNNTDESWPWSPAVAAWSSSSRTWAAPSSGPRPAPSPPGPIRGQYSGHRPIREGYFSSPAKTLRWSGGSARSRQRSWCGPEH